MAQIPQRTISQFKSKLIGGGARPNLFEVQINFPDGVDLGIKVMVVESLMERDLDFYAKQHNFLLLM